MRNNRETPVVRDCMNQDTPIVGPGNDVFEVIRLLVKRKRPGALVIEEGRGIVGVFSERSALRVLANTAYDRQLGGLASDFMEVAPESLSPDTDLFLASQRLLESGAAVLPVVEDGRLVGAVTQGDIVRAMEALEGLVAATEATWDRYVKGVTDPESKEEMQPYLADATPEQRAESFRNRKTLQARDETEHDLPR